MEKVKSVDEFFLNLQSWNDELSALRTVLLETELKEDIKWGIPTYVLGGKNIVSFAGFKNHFALWFFNGAFLTDSTNVLTNAQEGKTKALRQWCFKTKEDINVKLLLSYVLEAIENQKEGKVIAPVKNTNVDIPCELKDALDSDTQLLKCFNSLTKGRQKEYCNYISEAKMRSNQN